MSPRISVRTSRWLKSVVLLVSVALVLVVNLAAQQQKPNILVPTGEITVSPTGAEQGNPLTITATIRNTGTTASGPFDVVFSLFPADPETLEPTGPSIQLGSDKLLCKTSPRTEPPPANLAHCRIRSLSPVNEQGFQTQIEAELKTDNLEPNTYRIIVQADPSGEVDELNENDNEENSNLFQIAPVLPNLTVLAAFTLSPAQPRQGDLVALEFTIENGRRQPITKPIGIQIELRKRVDGERDFRPLVTPALSCPNECVLSNGLGANSRQTIRTQLVTTLLEAGAYELRVVVDPRNDLNDPTDHGAIEEFDESDNVLTLDFVLGDPPRNLTISGGRLTPSTPAPGSLVSFSFSIQNESLGVVTGVELQLSLSQSETNTVLNVRDLSDFACSPAGALESGKDQCAALTVGPNGALEVVAQFAATDLAVGNYELQAIVDPPTDGHPEGVIAETNERDNTLLLPFAISTEPIPQIAPELHPTGIVLIPTSPVIQGQKVLASATITNSGNQDAREFRVEFSLRREDVSQQQGFAPFGTQTISALRLGKTIEVRSVFDTSGLEPGLYAIKVVVNGLGQAELDGNNNSIIAFLTVAPKP